MRLPRLRDKGLLLPKRRLFLVLQRTTGPSGKAIGGCWLTGCQLDAPWLLPDWAVLWSRLALLGQPSLSPRPCPPRTRLGHSGRQVQGLVHHLKNAVAGR